MGNGSYKLFLVAKSESSIKMTICLAGSLRKSEGMLLGGAKGCCAALNFWLAELI